MARFPTLDRRQFLGLGALSAAGLLIGCSPELDTIAAFSETDGKEAFRNAWLHIDGDGAITFFVPASEMGQGVQTALTMIVAEEMDADWTVIRTVFAPYHAAFDNPDYMVQVTGGSNSVTSHWEKLRKLGAAARAMLVEAAAESWGVAAADCATEGSTVRHPDGRSAGYGELAAAAARIPPPSDPPLKDAASFRLVGQPVRRLDTPGKISGAPIYGIDVRLPDMLYATVAQSPVTGATIAGMNEAAALASPGVRAVVPIHNGVAVVADSFWRAKKGLEALSIAWDDGPNADESSARFTEAMKASLAEMAMRGFDGAAHRLDVEYQTPLLAHQPLEPMNCTAHVTADFCRVWVPTQNQQSASAAIRHVTGLPKDRIEINTTHLGGGFGRRLESDFVRQAVTVAKAVGKPVKLLWTREEDMRHDFYRPMSRVRFQIALGQDSMPTNWRVKVAEPSHFERALDDNLPHLAWIPVEAIMGDVNMGAGLSRSFVETNPFPYAVDDLDVDTEIMDFALPTGSHRSVQHSLSGFCKEAVVDECAHAAGIDPVEYRRRLLAGEPRYLGVLELAVEKAGWGRTPQGRFQGIAVHRSFGTWVAEVAEISVGGTGELTIHRIVCAVDCGRVINPAIAESQVHGAVLWGLEGALFSEITVEGGRVEQSNFHDYRVMHLSEAPPVEVHFVDSDAHPTGLGEPGTPPAAGALVNAIFAATGRRIRELPLTRHGFSV